MPETDRNDCKVCRRSNNLDNMVFCPRCGEWFHYHCAGVNESVADRSWLCGNCSIIPPEDFPPGQTSTPVNSISVVTTVPSINQPSIVASVPLSLTPMSVATCTSTTTRKSYLTEQARASLQWIQEHRDMLEREMEENHRQEVERKRLELKKLANQAMIGVIDSTKDGIVNSFEEQPEAAAGICKVQNWMQQMVGEMRNLSIAQPSGRTFDISSIPTTAGAHSSWFDPTLSSTLHGAQGSQVIVSSATNSSVPAYTVPPLQLPSSIQVGLPPLSAPPAPQAALAPPQLAVNVQSEIDQFRCLGALPRGLVSRVPLMSESGINTATNVVTACSTIPTVGLPAIHQGFSISSGVAGPQQHSGLGTYAAHTTAYSTSVPGLASNCRVVNNGHVNPRLPFPGHAGNYSANSGLPFGQNMAQGFYGPFGQPFAPTQHQLLARQVLPKDLPQFRGDPEDWPLFYSAYMNSTTACGCTDVENLARLQKALQGRALEVVKSRLLLPACVPQVLNTLYMLYGRPELIIQTLLNKVREVQAPKPDRLDTLISFGMAVQNLCDHLEAAGQLAHLCNPVLLQELVEKIPAQQRLDWALYKRQFVAVDLRTFATYMSSLVAAASDVTVIADIKYSRPGRGDRSKEKNYLNTHSAVEPLPLKKENKEGSVFPVICLACNGTSHKVKDCAVFKKFDPESRWKTVQDHHLCRICLGKHGRRPCKSQASCGIEGCQQRHHQLLHSQVQKQQTSTNVEQKTVKPNKDSGEGVNAHHTSEKSTLFRIIPVQIFWNGKAVDTFAFLDDGSSMTLIEQSVADRLGIDDGEPLPLCLTWTSNVKKQVPNSQRVSLRISAPGGSECFALNDTRTVANLMLPKQTLQYEELARQYSHLRGLPISSYKAVSPGILIGSNNASLIATLKLREGQLGDPLATKTRLGWSILGYAAEGRDTTNFSFHICECQGEASDQELHDLVKSHFSLESVGVSADKGPESEEDERARRILEGTTKRTSKGFETGLLWRTDNVEFPNSFPMAMRRLECFERRMSKDSELRTSVHHQISEYVESNYIHEVTPEELASTDRKKVWYLPLGAIRNPKKPGKIRLVWDAAAKVGGISLNTMLLKGPDMLVPLAAVLCGFRQHSVAVCGDLKQMFHQFRIRKEDAQSQRFLYREHPSLPVKIFVMDVGSFGATCSPSQAQYIKNLNAKEHEKAYPQAANAIVLKHYVDDYLDSFDTEDEAIKVALQVKEIHARGGFEIRNWHSNSATLLERVGEPKQKKPKAINIDAETETERVLGLLWLPEEDSLAFATDLQLDETIPTKRNILRCVMSLFDSQGILSNITVQGRIIIQDTWRSKLKWDEKVDDAIHADWLRWILLFKKVNQR